MSDQDEEPVEAVEDAPESEGRRRFLTGLSVVLGTATAVIIAAPALSFVIAPLVGKSPRVWRKVGPVANFKVGETVAVSFESASAGPQDGIVGHQAAWLRRESEGEFIAYAVNCSHLGCPVRWMPSANLFLCPCHGGVYYSNGDVAGGPPPRPLSRYPVRIRDGQVELQARDVILS